MGIKKLLFLAGFAGILAIGFAPSARAATIEELQALINKLKAQIAELQKELDERKAKPAAFCYNFNTNLGIGSSGPDVEALGVAFEKEGLIIGGFIKFDESVASEVVGFQQKYREDVLTPYGLQFGTGFVGETTRAQLNKLYGCGAGTPPAAGVVPVPTPPLPPSPAAPQSSLPPSVWRVPVLVLSYLPLDSAGKLDRSIIGPGFPEAERDPDLLRQKIRGFNANYRELIKKASRYKGYKNPVAPSSLEYVVVQEKEYREPMPAEFSILDGDPESGKWSAQPGFVGDSFLIDLKSQKTISSVELYFWSADRPEMFHVDVSSTGSFNGEERRVVTETDGLNGYAAIRTSSPIEKKAYLFAPVNARYATFTVDAYRKDNPEGTRDDAQGFVEGQINLYEVVLGADMSRATSTSLDAREVPPTDKMKYLGRENICEYVDGAGIREVWAWMYHSKAVYPMESDMAMGKNSARFWNKNGYGDVSNSPRINDMPVCNNTYTVYEFNYGRGPAEMMENLGHQIEALFHYIEDDDNKQREDDGLFWKRWVGSEYVDERIYNPGCGWTHYAPNSTRPYDWYSESSVFSDCENWKPDRTGAKAAVTCHTWAGEECVDDGGVAWKVWWMQNMPGKDNGLTYKGNPLRNWWDFVGDFDGALQKGKSLVSFASEPVPAPPPVASISLDAQSPAGSAIFAGTRDVSLARIKISGSGSGAFMVNSVQIGTDSEHVQNIRIYEQERQVGATAASLIYNGSYYSSWIPVGGLAVAANGSKTLRLVADVASQGNGTAKLGIVSMSFADPAVLLAQPGLPVYGNSFRIVEAPAVSLKYPPCGSYGDVNQDGYVTRDDAVQLATNYLLEKLTATDKMRGDVNGDGAIDGNDTALIEQFAAGTTTTFPVCALGFKDIERQTASILDAVERLAQEVKEFLSR